MSKHSLVSIGLGLGLMAASMGASAQLHTFDYSSLYFGSVAGGSKYTAFVPTINRGAASASEGAAGVVMLEFFQPASGSASTWAFAIGGAVNSVAGGSDSASLAAYNSIALTADNGLALTHHQYFGGAGEVKLGFNQTVMSGTQACNVAFDAVIGTNDQLAFANVVARADGWFTANGPVVVTTGSGAPVTIDAAFWNNASATGASNYAINSSLSMVVPGSVASSTYLGSLVNTALQARSKCVPAYTARAAGSGTVITGQPIGLVRIW